jgi:hypothetical protein
MNVLTKMYAIITIIEDRKCAPAIIPELTILPSSRLLLLRIEYSTATVKPCEGLIPWSNPNTITPSRVASYIVIKITCVVKITNVVSGIHG